MIPGFDMITEAAGVVAGVMAVISGGSLLTFAIGVSLYILRALGLYTIAMRRGIQHPWMAWLPVTNMWILGSISDQYRYVSLGQIRNRRKVLLGLCIAIVAMMLVLFGTCTSALIKLILQIPEIMRMTPQQFFASSLGTLLLTAGLGLLIWVLAVIKAVFQYVCLYDLYASCNPNNKVLFLVLSILANVTLPFFVFACRKQDGGMPPRKDEVPAALPAEISEE